MNTSGAQKYNLEQLRQIVNDEVQKKDLTKHIYKSADGVFRIIDAIVKTNGKNWAAQVLDNEGKALLTKEEQEQFTEAFKPYTETIIHFFGENEITGGAIPDVQSLSGLSKEFIDKKLQNISGDNNEEFDPTKMVGIDDIYGKIYNRIGQLDKTVNDYASKYGILKLEKEHDLEADVRLIPQPAQAFISEGIFSLSTAAGFPIPPNLTLDVLDKIKLPFRTIIFTIYLTLDIARIAMGVTDRTTGRKILSIVVSVIDLLRGDWKKAILSFIGYFGMRPLLIGQIVKLFVSLYEMLAPQLQSDIYFGALDTSKSLLIGFLLAIFQVTAPEEVRLPFIGILEKIAQKKAELDGNLIDAGLSARPDYLAPTFEDLNNLQAVMSDDAFICSKEFEELISQVNKSAIIRIILQILRIPVTEEFRNYKCGTDPSKSFAETLVNKTKEEQEEKERQTEPLSMKNLEMPVSVKGGKRKLRLSSKKHFISE
jgi:hypothetical protein